MTVALRGITWSHSRGYSSIVAATQRYSEIHPEFDVSWEKRSLQEFADKPIGDLAREYDLLVIDHPWAGHAAKSGVLLPLDQWVASDYLKDQAENSVGKSFESYRFEGYQSALPIDAASPIAVWRPDLIKRSDVPKTFNDVLELAGMGKVIYPAIPINLLMDFYALCNTAGGRLFEESLTGRVVDHEVGAQVLDDMRRLASMCDRRIFGWDPIAVHEYLASHDDFSYCPSAYGYSNYSRPGYARCILKAGDLVSYQGSMLTGVLGGTGLAISSATKHPLLAASFASYVASSEVQKTIYFDAGGQPGHRSAWIDEECNRRSLNFFADTLTSLDLSLLRPRYDGYLGFQDIAGNLIWDYVKNGGREYETLGSLDKAYRRSLSTVGQEGDLR